MLKEIISLFFPHLCVGCEEPINDIKQQICLKCRFQIPLTEFDRFSDNPVEKLLWGKAPVKAATSYFYFKKDSSLQKAIHSLKYEGNQRMGLELGQWMGEGLKDSPRFPTPDFLIPVPLHRKKEKTRGYNQSELLAQGINQVTHVPIHTGNLIRSVHTTSQTQKGHYERFENMSTSFQVEHPDKLQGKKVWLIDDVITTGSTLAECATALGSVQNIEIFAVTVAVAS
ncbi:ComF family protein [bacterium SCSIO 12741]|nr:ComF family protein [bacterium SCSIO 12741]